MLRKLSRSFGGIRRYSKKSVVVIGAGDYTGSAIAKRFAKEGLIVCAVRRQGNKLNALIQDITENGGEAYSFDVDCRKENEVVELIEQIETIAPIDALVFNIGANIKIDVVDLTSKKYFKVWEMACFSGFLVGREVAKRMIPRGRGVMLYTGATASIRGGAGFSAFAGAKHGLRALAQSMARELGPKGIHVAHVIIDGAIDTAWIHENFPLAKEKSEVEGLLAPEEIAQNYWFLYTQQKSAWTFEMDLRPWVETW